MSPASDNVVEQVALGLLSIVQNDEVRSLVRDVLREEMFPDELKGLDASDFEDSFVQQQRYLVALSVSCCGNRRRYGQRTQRRLFELPLFNTLLHCCTVALLIKPCSKEIRKDIANSSTKFIEDIEMLDACAKDCLCDNIVSLRRRIISKKFLGAKVPRSYLFVTHFCSPSPFGLKLTTTAQYLSGQEKRLF